MLPKFLHFFKFPEDKAAALDRSRLSHEPPEHHFVTLASLDPPNIHMTKDSSFCLVFPLMQDGFTTLACYSLECHKLKSR